MESISSQLLYVIFNLGLNDFIYTMSMPGYMKESAKGHSRIPTFPMEARNILINYFSSIDFPEDLCQLNIVLNA